ncbi:MAG: hypothetical protein GC193_12340 [Cryomorphaceae bacterium]|nr:hypothetical protein [Cryomorphaceae bacterium]
MLSPSQESFFESEYNCKLLFKKYRDKKGVVCQKCKGQSHYWYEYKWQWQCKKCNHPTTLKSGTILKYSKIPINLWLKALCVLSLSTAPISARQMQKILGAKRYESIWFLMHKLRVALGQSTKCIFETDGCAINDEIFDFLILKHHKGYHKSTKKLPEKAKVPVALLSYKFQVLEQGYNFKWPIVGLENYSWKEELDDAELTNKRRRYFLKRLSRFNFAPSLKVEAAQQPMPPEYLDSFLALKEKIFITHRGVTPRYLQKYLDEFFICHFLSSTLDPFDWLINCAVDGNW